MFGRRGWGVAAIIVAVALISWYIAIVATRKHEVAEAPPGCHVALDGQTYTLTQEQTAHATTISAVGKRLGMPAHAVSVALATALQESKLRNLDYGDRDSLGLFQQRPSQGWGPRARS
jgi:hypothetical protein